MNIKNTFFAPVVFSSLCLISLSSLPIPLVAAELTVATGGRSGIYYQIGRSICRLMNRANAAHQACEYIKTGGSIDNLSQLKAGKIEIAVVQSDWQYHATHGSKRFAEQGPDQNLRALFSVHSEPFTVVTRRDAQINSFDDLLGKRVNVGNPGSGQRATMQVVMEAKAWTRDSFQLYNGLPADKQAMALCYNQVQAIVYTVGHPNPIVGRAIGLCEAKLVNVKGPDIEKLVNSSPYYAWVEIPGGIYFGNEQPITTFGVLATVVSSSTVSEEKIYQLVKTVFEQLQSFKKMHPTFNDLQAPVMIKDGLSAPLHKGALRYYKEVGLI